MNNLAIRLFVSSTFSDMKAERDALQESVFPRLKKLCASYGLRFQAIDLRWGISNEAWRDNRTMRICFQELQRCQQGQLKPNFLILLGNRYGWQPLPEILAAGAFAKLHTRLEAGDKTSAELLLATYRRDDNNLPPIYELQPQGDDDSWPERVAKPLLAAIELAVAAGGPEPEWEALNLGASATEQEIVAGALTVSDAAAHVCAFFRSAEKLPALSPAESVESPDVEPKLARLRRLIAQKIGEPNIGSYHLPKFEGKVDSVSLESFCELAWSKLSLVVLRQIETLQQFPAEVLEQQAHEAFGRDRCRTFVGQRPFLESLRQYCRGEDLHPLVLCSASGQGKTALLARFAEILTKEQTSGGGFEVICRHVGATPASSDLVQLLRNLVWEIERRYPGDVVAEFDGKKAAIPLDIVSLLPRFRESLYRPTVDRPLCLVIDSLDQLTESHDAHMLSWLPASTGPHCHLIVSTAIPELAGGQTAPVTTGPQAAVWVALHAKHSVCQRLYLAAATDEEAEQMLANWLAEKKRTLQPAQRQAILGAFQVYRSPLWLRIASQEAVRLVSWMGVPEMAPSVSGLLEQLMNRLARGEEHGTKLVARALSYLACARHGLAEDELLDILSADQHLMLDLARRSPKSPKVDRLPVVVWARLLGDLDFLLAERFADESVLLGFHHRQLHEAVCRMYLTPGCRKDTHRAMGRYFLGAAKLHERRDWGEAPLRALSELPHHRLHGYTGLQNEALFCDLLFIEASIRKGLLDQLLADFEAASRLPAPRVNLIRNVVTPSLPVLRQLPESALVTIINRLRNEDLGGQLRSRVHRGEKALDARGGWLCAMTRFGLNQSVKGLVTLSVSRNVCQILKEAGELETRTLNTQKPIESSTPFLGATPSFIINHPQTGKMIWGDIAGNLYSESQRLPVQLNPRAHALTFWDNGIVGINSQRFLFYYDLQAYTVSILAENLSSIAARSASSQDGKVALVVSGDRIPGQRIFLLDNRTTYPQTNEWPAFETPVTEASLDESGAWVVVALRNRILKMITSQARQLIAEISSRVAGGKAVRGNVVSSHIAWYGGQAYVLLATAEGELLVWDHSNHILRDRGFYRGIQEQSEVRALASNPACGVFIVATNRQILELPMVGESELKMATPINGCAIAATGQTVQISSAARSVRWIEQEQTREVFLVNNYEPSAIAVTEDGAVAFAGYSRGSVIRLLPACRPELEDAVDLFDRPVVSLVGLDEKTVLAASANGQFRIVGFQPVQVLREIEPVGIGREEQFIRRVGQGNDFLTCGRSQYGNAISSIVVIRSDNSREVVTETRELIKDAVANLKGDRIYVAFNEAVHCYTKKANRWVANGERSASVNYLAVVGGDFLCAIQHQGEIEWLEVWPLFGDWKVTLALSELPFPCHCLDAKGNFITVGSIDGRYAIFEFRTR